MPEAKQPRHQPCEACGARRAYATPWRIGEAGNCKTCGATKCKQRPTKLGRPSKAMLAQDEAFDTMLQQVVEARGSEIAVMPEPKPEPMPASEVILRPTLRGTQGSQTHRRNQGEAARQGVYEGASRQDQCRSHPPTRRDDQGIPR